MDNRIEEILFQYRQSLFNSTMYYYQRVKELSSDSSADKYILAELTKTMTAINDDAHTGFLLSEIENLERTYKDQYLHLKTKEDFEGAFQAEEILQSIKTIKNIITE